jgi:hypothetical protein
MKKRFILLLLTMGAFALSNAQDSLLLYSHTYDSTVHSGYKILPYQFLNGYIVLVKGDTVRGYFSIRSQYSYTTFNYCLFWGSQNPVPIKIATKDIKYIRADIESLGRHYAEIIVHKKGYWRVIKEKGGIIIYDGSAGIFSDKPLYHIVNCSKYEFNDNMFLVDGEHWINIYHNAGGFWEGRNISNKLILEFINKRYKLNLNQSDFKSGMEMVDFILDRENQKKQEGLPK